MHKLFGLVGSHLQYSFSKAFFETYFEKEGIHNSSYENFELQSIEELGILMEKENLLGFNVTIPFKESVIPFLNAIDSNAAEIGAVNCVKRKASQWMGYNTDCTGFERSITPLLFPRHKSALIFGSGGASKAVQYVLRKKGIAFQLVSHSGKAGMLSYEMIDEGIIHKSLLLINCTPLGSYPGITESPNIPYHAITSKHLLYDLLYNPKKSDFLQSGEAMGARIKNGLEMLEIQALESWRIWQEKD